MAADHTHPPLTHDALGNVSPAEHTHPDWKTYRWVALILTLLTGMEVYIYYLPSFVKTKLFVPTLLVLSATQAPKKDNFFRDRVPWVLPERQVTKSDRRIVAARGL